MRTVGFVPVQSCYCVIAFNRYQGDCGCLGDCHYNYLVIGLMHHFQAAVMKCTWIALIAAICPFLLSVQVLAAECPYCHQDYGEAAPGDAARVYALRQEHEASCSRSHHGNDQPAETSANYGVVTIYNRTNKAITYKLRRTAGGRWHRTTVQPGLSYCHWHNLSEAKFEIAFPGKHYNLDYNTVTGKEPVWTDGREYAFQGAAGDLDLITGAGSPSPGLSGFEVSVVGSGEGSADAPFGEATSASGTYAIDCMTGSGTKKIEGTWSAHKISDNTVAGAGYQSQVWRFINNNDSSEATAAIAGGAGTADSWLLRVPDTGTSELRIKFGVQFSGNQIRLLTFTKSY